MRFVRWPFPALTWAPAGAAALLWALAASSAMWWWLHVPRPEGAGLAQPVSTRPVPDEAAAAAGVLRALGQGTVQAATSESQRRFAPLGVVSGRSGAGSVLMAVDGQPAQVFVQGQLVAEGWRLQSVGADSVTLVPVAGGSALDVALPSRPR